MDSLEAVPVGLLGLGAPRRLLGFLGAHVATCAPTCLLISVEIPFVSAQASLVRMTSFMAA